MTSIFSGDLVLEDCIESYINTGVHEEDKELLRLTVSKDNLTKELS